MSDQDKRDEGKGEGAAPDEDAKGADAEASKEAEEESSESKKTEGAPSADSKDEPSEAVEEPAVKRPAIESAPPPERKAAAWGRPLTRLDAAWTKWEVALCAVTIILEILVLSLWVCLKGLSTASDGSSKAGLVFRALSGAIVLGVVAWWGLKKQPLMVRRGATVAASVAGLLLAKTWGHAGVDWASNMLNWFQQASFLTLLGGLRGVGTRLTLLLALLGGSLATAAGKHITIDLLTRYLRPKQRLPVVIAGWLGASFICATACWGFFDHIAIDDFDAKAEMTAGEKASTVTKAMGEHFFVARKQLALDMKSLPHVVKGERYSDYLSADEWNAWVRESGFAEHYGAEKAKLLELPSDMKKSPMVVVPEKGEPRAELTKAANLVFPIGLAVIAFRFILLCLLALSGHRSVDVEAHGDLAVVPGGKTDKHDPEPTKEDA